MDRVLLTMNETIEIQIRLYGPFKNYLESGHLVLHISPQAAVSEIKTALGLELGKLRPQTQSATLVARSVLATDTRILKENETLDCLENQRVFSILPPVCGG